MSRTSCFAPNKSLQETFDPPPIFAAAKTVVASNALSSGIRPRVTRGA